MSNKKETRQRLLDAGLNLARTGLHNVTPTKVAEKSGLSRQCVYMHFKCAEDLSDTVAAHAVKIGDERVKLRLRLDEHPAVM